MLFVPLQQRTILGVLLWSSRVMQKPADKHGEKVSIYNWDPAAATMGCVHLIIYNSAGRRTHVLFLRSATPTRLPKHGAERHCQSAGWSVRCRLRVVVNINFIRASIIANYFHWRERARTIHTRYFISQGVHGKFGSLRKTRYTWLKIDVAKLILCDMAAQNSGVRLRYLI
jgi:hypothetical protein